MDSQGAELPYISLLVIPLGFLLHSGYPGQRLFRRMLKERLASFLKIAACGDVLSLS